MHICQVHHKPCMPLYSQQGLLSRHLCELKPAQDNIACSSDLTVFRKSHEMGFSIVVKKSMVNAMNFV